MDHGLEAHVDLATSDDLGDIGGVIGLEQSDLETFILEVASGLGEVEGGVVRGRVPLRKEKKLSQVELQDRASSKGSPETRKLRFWTMSAYQLVKKVILSVDMMAERSSY